MLYKEFVPYEPSLALKELGFYEECLASYTVFGDGEKRDGYYGQTEPQLFINGIGVQIEDRMEELEMFAYHVCSAPTFSQAFRWFRERYQIDSWIYPNLNGLYSVSIVRRGVGLGNVSQYQTYPEAELACLIKLIEIVKKK